MITLDTSGLFAFINRDDPFHPAVRAALEADGGPWVLPAGILAEVGYLLESRGGVQLLQTFVHDLIDQAYSLDCGDKDLPRIATLVAKYADLPLGFADAAVAACAERHGGRVLTLDRRHFVVLARGERGISLVPEIV